MSDHDKCQYCTDQRICDILKEECLMDNPDEVRCKEMYDIPCDKIEDIITQQEESDSIFEDDDIEDIMDESGEFQSEDDELDDLIEENY